MYPAPPVNRTFNNSLLHHQPLTKSVQINRNQNELSQAKLGESFLKDNSNTKDVTKSTINTERTSRKRAANFITARSNNQDCASSQQSNLETIPAKRATPLINSRSHGTLHDRIQRERRAHTMAPLARITGPSSTPQAKLFATAIAPIDNQLNKSHHFTQKSFKNSYGRSDIEMTDDDTPIIVKVRYDAQTGILPSEAAIRQAIDHQIFDRKKKKDPIIVNFFGQNKQPQLSKPFPNRVALQPSYTFPSIPHPPHPFLRHKKIHPVQAPKPTINRQQNQSLQIPRLPNRNISSAWANGVYPTGINNFKPIHRGMASQQSAGNEVFRPPPVKDIPELSRENLLNMLNQIPDLQGRRFNIEYAPPSAPEGYPIPSNLDPTNNTYPEPVVIDKLPTNVIQHVKSSNNPALTAALEQTIQQEQHLQSHPPTVVHHAAQPYQQVQQSRPVSSNDSDSSTEVSSSGTSSSEETDSEESERVSTAQSGNTIPFVGPIPPKST